MKSSILLTGGAGIIGSHTYLECSEYLKKNF
jgi:UDP-glucose 4-epimerase